MRNRQGFFMNQKRNFSLDLIRAAAFFLVFFYHYNMTLGLYGISSPFLTTHAGANFDFGQWGTILFVLLSGFTSVGSYRKAENKSFGKRCLLYYGKRALSIVPVYLICYLCFFILYRLPSFDFDGSLIYTLFCLDGYLSTFGVHTCYLTGEWFVGLILILYLLFPFLYEAVRKKPVLSLIAAAVLNIGMIFLAWRLDMPDSRIICFAFPFIYGIFLACYVKTLSHAAGIAAIVFSVLLIALPLPLNYRFLLPLLGLSSFLALRYIGSLLEKPQNKAFSAVRLAIGKISKYSFAMFLVHHILMDKILSPRAGADFGRWMYAGYFLLLLAVSAAAGLFLTGAAAYVKEKMVKSRKT